MPKSTHTKEDGSKVLVLPSGRTLTLRNPKGKDVRRLDHLAAKVGTDGYTETDLVFDLLADLGGLDGAELDEWDSEDILEAIALLRSFRLFMSKG